MPRYTPVAQFIPMAVGGTLGTNTGAGSDGVLIGKLTAADPDTVLLKGQTVAGLCVTEDGNLFVDETTPFNEDTGDDVEVLPSTPAVGDASYYGHATQKISAVLLNITTQGAGTWTITWEYWDGDAWTALSNVTDGTTGFTATTGWKTVSFDVPTDWATCPIDELDGYWIRGRVSAYTSVTTAPQVGQGWVTTDEAFYTDDTTDFTDAGAGDVKLLPDYPVVGDALLIGHDEKFCKVKVTTSTARTGTATVTPKYWNGSAWSALTTVDDDTAGWSTTAGTLLINFVPPSDWTACTAANGPNGQTGYFISMELTALTDVTAQPVATQGWVYPIKTDAEGIECPIDATTFKVDMTAQTNSGSTQDSTFLLVNATQGTFTEIAWTKATSHVQVTGTFAIAAEDNLAIVQVTEDGTTEFADANFALCVVP